MEEEGCGRSTRDGDERRRKSHPSNPIGVERECYPPGISCGVRRLRKGCCRSPDVCPSFCRLGRRWKSTTLSRRTPSGSTSLQGLPTRCVQRPFGDKKSMARSFG
ncbi:hypothetical protein CEXT_448711 [Caerostris extrusa]|uniref:Uncharacterized protein n=1 Tax=Caerostris extrusa TaxID=172846 RepID=A0AAV4XM39_CAEEX|nr:hypothetical protein CEXT_448711 [Caerostris extrusa]